MKAVATSLILALLAVTAGDAFASQEAVKEAMAWQSVAATIPLGSRVKIHNTRGDRMSGTLMSVGADGVMVKKNTRRPEPAVTVAYSEMARIERDQGTGANVGKAIAIGLAAGTGVILGLFAIALQLD